MLTEAEKKRLAELYSTGYERFFGESDAAEKARRELTEFLNNSTSANVRTNPCVSFGTAVFGRPNFG